ncbi:pentatricopeptide repeat-containing protein At1g12775, mitochondrial-like [Pistacia vera]|uniref:pentatricopeptide repeat-containing protein At1g12775, mitochondrial-like n=1 Tax=Pistacia vera TaxID=55513 RepID=UPI001262CA98|nr:pentatricopeptide repeat-containing protein At1g12775, mitochondrial-like [Pistacia vera]
MDLTNLPKEYQDALSSMVRAEDEEAAMGLDPKEKHPEDVPEEPTPRQNLTTSRSKKEVLCSFKKPLERSLLAKFLEENGRSGLCVEKRIMESRELFKKMVAVDSRPDVITYTTLIHGLCCVGDWEEGKRLFILMMDQGVRPSVVTFGVVIHECCKKGNLDETNRFMELMIQRGVDPDICTYDILKNGYCLVDRIGDARELFDSITRKGYKPNVVCYNTLINWYCKNKEVNKALSLYREMISEGIRLDVIIAVSLSGEHYLTTLKYETAKASASCGKALSLLLYSYQTPEAWTTDHGLRVLCYMRLMAIWAMQWALRRLKPSKNNEMKLEVIEESLYRYHVGLCEVACLLKVLDDKVRKSLLQSLFDYTF